MNIYRVDEVDCVYHWVIADEAGTAKEIVWDNLVEKPEGITDPKELGCTKLPLDYRLSLHGESKAITLTVEEWLIVYEYQPKYLGCSEY